MPLSSNFPSTTLTHAGSPYFLSAIPVALVRAFTTESASDKDRNTVASQVFNLYGETGSLALWFFQSHRENEEADNASTQWLLNEHNALVPSIKKVLGAVQSLEVALHYLDCATRYPRHLTLASSTAFVRPYQYETTSPLWAKDVRALAALYFPQHPELTAPTCPLYRDVVEYDYGQSRDYDLPQHLRYAKPFEAFEHDIHALRYLACALPDWAVQDSPAFRVFREHQNEQWRLYKDMGLSLEDAYRLESGTKEIMAMPLPEGIVPGHS